MKTEYDVNLEYNEEKPPKKHLTQCGIRRELYTQINSNEAYKMALTSLLSHSPF